MIGTTRETVSRLFSDFKKRQLIQVNSGKGFHFGDPQQASGGEIGASVKAFNEQAG
jgi:Crp-like helix-turn-helix domain